jgi:hypothetical protein
MPKIIINIISRNLNKFLVLHSIVRTPPILL